MSLTIDGLRLRRVLGRDRFPPPRPFGPDGWSLTARDGGTRVIVTGFRLDDSAVDWVHASISHPAELPTYEELVLLHRAVFGEDGYAYQVFAPVSEHVNIHSYALHLWGRLDGAPVLPEFAAALGGVI